MALRPEAGNSFQEAKAAHSGGTLALSEGAGGSARLKVFFVGDNQSNVNWGRGASIALDRLLSASFEISGRVTGDFFDLSTAEAGYVGTLMPARYYRHFKNLLRRRWRRSIGWYIQLEHLFGAKDFIAEDPVASVNTLLAHKRRHPALNRIYRQAAEADLVVVDGDGDIIFTTPPRRATLFLLAMIELGIRLKKPVFLVNSMISDCPLTGRNQATLAVAGRLLAQCRAVALRDPESLEYVRKEIPKAESCFIPDSLFAWLPAHEDAGFKLASSSASTAPQSSQLENENNLDFSHPYICIGGGALAGSQPDRAAQCYSRMVEAISQLGYRVYLTENDAPDSFLQRVAKEKNVGILPADAPIDTCASMLAGARLFISGRYHPSIFASLGGTPCIFLATHAHKMGSLSRVLDYEVDRQFNAFPNDSEISEIVSLAKQYIDRGETLRARIRQAAMLRSKEVNQLPALLKRHMNG